MKKFILRTLIFLLIMVGVDLVAGFAFNFLLHHAKGGKTAQTYYIDQKAKEDILILGSSRARHHYDPYLIEDSTGLSCLNCGVDGNGIVVGLARFEQVLQHKKPKLIIYDIQPSYDYLTDYDNTRYLSEITPFYDEPSIKGIFASLADWQEQTKMNSRMYRYNSKILDFVSDNIFARNYHKGYSPFNGQLKDVQVAKPKTRPAYKIKVDEGRMKLIEELIQLAQKNEVKLLFVVSPSYRYDFDASKYAPIKDLCQKYQVPYLDYNHDARFDHQELYQDRNHLNKTGATMFTKIMIEEIRKNVECGM